MTDLEALDDQLNSAVVEGLGDSLTYKRYGLEPVDLIGFVDFGEVQRNLPGTAVIDQAISVEIPVSALPEKPSSSDRIGFARLPARLFKPLDPRRDASATFWQFEVQEVGGASE